MVKSALNIEQRNRIADKLMMLGNIVFSGMVIAPLVSQDYRGLADVFMATAGAVIFFVMYSISVWIMRGGVSN